MLVKCVSNNVSFVEYKNAAERVRKWVNTEGVYYDLEVGQRYEVQAVDYFDGGVFYYLHSVEVSEYPYPYVSELFIIEDSSIPESWEVGFHVENGRKRFTRLAFREWAENDMFYENLINGLPDFVAAYAANRIR